MPERRYRAKELMTVSETGFVLDVEDGESYTFNPTALCVVRALLAHRDSRELWRELAERFDVSPAEAKRDVARFLEQLHAQNLVVQVD